MWMAVCYSQKSEYAADFLRSLPLSTATKFREYDRRVERHSYVDIDGVQREFSCLSKLSPLYPIEILRVLHRALTLRSRQRDVDEAHELFRQLREEAKDGWRIAWYPCNGLSQWVAFRSINVIFWSSHGSCYFCIIIHRSFTDFLGTF